jgi:hypothetical protein
LLVPPSIHSCKCAVGGVYWFNNCQTVIMTPNPTTTSETPRAEQAICSRVSRVYYVQGEREQIDYVTPDFARTLERELNEARKELSNLNDHICVHHNDAERTAIKGVCFICIKNRYESLQKSFNRLTDRNHTAASKMQWDAMVDRNKYLEQHLTSANALIKRMAEALGSLPLDKFNKDSWDIDAADYVDSSARFYSAMQLARETLTAYENYLKETKKD